jgi:hypothetical protein
MNTGFIQTDHCFETGTNSLHSLRRTCNLLSVSNYPPRPPAMSSTSSFLDLYEPLDVIGNGSFGIIRKVRRKQDGVVSFLLVKKVVAP